MILKERKNKTRLIVIIIFILAVLAGIFDFPDYWNKGVNFVNSKLKLEEKSLKFPHFPEKAFTLGLDLQGGVHLIYEADLSQIPENERDESMNGIRDVIERRVNLFGVAEPVVQVEKAGNSRRLVVELAGVKDIQQAIDIIGQTPYLEFKEERATEENEELLKVIENKEEGWEYIDPYFKQTLLNGRFLKKANLDFDQTTFQSRVNMEFNDEGAKLFEEITSRNINKRVAIYLDGVPISAPVVKEAISGGKAQITGSFTAEEAKEMVRRLNAGALPVPIKIISEQSVGASLGSESLTKSLRAAFFGFLAVIIFMLIYYRFPGLIAVITLLIYIVLVLAVFKLIPVTLTLAGIAGFILSVGMAIDANVLILERFKEERRSGKSFGGSVDEGFKRAWSSIRDGNVSTLITALILYWFGTSFVKGFALTLILGIIFSMLSAVVITRILMKIFTGTRLEGKEWLWK